jgi:hypothetical protein
MRKRRMLKALRTSAMILALVGSAHAGDVLTPPTPQPPPQSIVTEEPTADDSVISDTPDTLTGIALGLLAVLPSLF